MRNRLFALPLMAALAWSHSQAGIPSAANSTIPSHIVLVGMNAGVPDAVTGAFTIIVRDVGNTEEQDRLVELRLLNCPGARVASDQAQADISSKCSTHGITGISAFDGTVHMVAVGAGDGGPLHGSGGCASIWADGVFLGYVSVAYLDQNGVGGLGAADLSIWLSDYITGDPIGRSDYDGDGALSAADLSIWLTAFQSGRQTQSPGAFCP